MGWKTLFGCYFWGWVSLEIFGSWSANEKGWVQYSLCLESKSKPVGQNEWYCSCLLFVYFITSTKTKHCAPENRPLDKGDSELGKASFLRTSRSFSGEKCGKQVTNMAALRGFLRPGPTTMLFFPPKKNVSSLVLPTFFVETFREFLPTQPPPKKTAEYLIWLAGKVEKPIFFRFFFSGCWRAGEEKGGLVGMGHKIYLTRSGLSWERWEVKPKVVRKLLVEKPLFGMGHKNPELHTKL